jgi:hypothetical protein
MDSAKPEAISHAKQLALLCTLPNLYEAVLSRCGLLTELPLHQNRAEEHDRNRRSPSHDEALIAQLLQQLPNRQMIEALSHRLMTARKSTAAAWPLRIKRQHPNTWLIHIP